MKVSLVALIFIFNGFLYARTGDKTHPCHGNGKLNLCERIVVGQVVDGHIGVDDYEKHYVFNVIKPGTYFVKAWENQHDIELSVTDIKGYDGGDCNENFSNGIEGCYIYITRAMEHTALIRINERFSSVPEEFKFIIQFVEDSHINKESLPEVAKHSIIGRRKDIQPGEEIKGEFSKMNYEMEYKIEVPKDGTYLFKSWDADVDIDLSLDTLHRSSVASCDENPSNGVEGCYLHLEKGFYFLYIENWDHPMLSQYRFKYDFVEESEVPPDKL